jgi:hypothetical protein
MLPLLHWKIWPGVKKSTVSPNPALIATFMALNSTVRNFVLALALARSSSSQ